MERGTTGRSRAEGKGQVLDSRLRERDLGNTSSFITSQQVKRRLRPRSEVVLGDGQ